MQKFCPRDMSLRNYKGSKQMFKPNQKCGSVLVRTAVWHVLGRFGTKPYVLECFFFQKKEFLKCMSKLRGMQLVFLI
jgi:hypothetical protein